MTQPPEPDLWFGGRLKLRQPPRGAHRAGTDAALLSGLITAGDGEMLVDAGAGTGAVGLAAACRSPRCRVLLVERDPALAALARINIETNGLCRRVEMRVADLFDTGTQRRAAGLSPDLADIVLTNPPFFEAGRQRVSPNAAKAAAHTFGAHGLDAWLRACVDLLRPGGRLGLIHRADALPDCLDALRGRFGAIRVRPVLATTDRPAIRILVKAVKGSRGGFVLERPLVLHGADGRFTAEAEALHRGHVENAVSAADRDGADDAAGLGRATRG